MQSLAVATVDALPHLEIAPYEHVRKRSWKIYSGRPHFEISLQHTDGQLIVRERRYFFATVLSPAARFFVSPVTHDIVHRDPKANRIELTRAGKL